MSTNISNERRKQINAAHRHLLRYGQPSTKSELRDITSGSGSGSPLVPQEFDKVWADALATVSPIVQLVHKQDSQNSRSFKQVTVDPTGQYLTLVGQGNTTTGISQQPTVSSNVAVPDSLVGRVDVSWNELDDAFQLDDWLRRTAAVIVGRSLERAILTATDGAGNALPGSPTGGLLASAPVGFTQTAQANGIPYSSLRALISSLEHVYMQGPNSGLLASQSVHDYLALQVDSTGRELYCRSKDTGNLLINGYQLYVANNTAAPAYNAVSSNVLLAGDFSRGYGITLSDVHYKVIDINPQLLTSTVLFYVSLGANALVTNAVKAFQTAAS